MGQATLNDFERERKALGAVLASGALPRASNPARLLSFLCERYFEDPTRELTEYDIAVGARSVAGATSILEKIPWSVWKCIPDFASGSRISTRPMVRCCRRTFCCRRDNTRPSFSTFRRSYRRKSLLARRTVWIWPVAFLVVLLAGAIWFARTETGNAKTVPLSVESPGVSGQSEVRLLAGFPSGQYIDQYGHLWAGDAYFQGGAATEVHYGRLARTADPALYQHAREGFEFSYDIPLNPGTYEVRLHFAESSMRVPIVGESGESLRRFRVTANEKQLLPPLDGRHARQFDIFSDTGGEDLADVKVLKNIVPAADGKLHLKFLSDKQAAIVNAIEIVPGVPN